MLNKLPPVTRFLLIANVAVFLLQMAVGDRALANFMLWPISDGTYSPSSPGYSFLPWQLLSYGFLHGSFMHLLFNMFALYMFGPPLEHTWGNRRFAIYFLGCVVGAGVLQLVVGWWTLSNGGQAYPTIGASGGVLGLVLAFGLLFPQQKLMIFPLPFFIPARVAVLLIGGLSLLAGTTGSMPGIAHFAHLGGMLTGWLLIRYWSGQPPFGKRRPPGPRSVS